MPTDLSGYPPEFAALLEHYNQEIEALMKQLEAKSISAEAWQKAMQKLLSKYAQAARLLGGALEELSQDDIAAVKAFLKDQFTYLDGFTAVIKSAQEYLAAWLPRAQMYGAATVTEYWEGKTAGLPLPAQPGQGTQCLGNCKCAWRIEWIDQKAGDADCYWTLSAAEHCQTCEVRSKQWAPVHIRKGMLQ